MKAVVIAIILGVAGALLYFALRTECAQEMTFASESECRARLSPDLCRDAFEAAERKAVLDYPPFATQDDCNRQFPHCMPHGAVGSGYVPVPGAVCVVPYVMGKGADGSPIYRKYGPTVRYR